MWKSPYEDVFKLVQIKNKAGQTIADLFDIIAKKKTLVSDDVVGGWIMKWGVFVKLEKDYRMRLKQGVDVNAEIKKGKEEKKKRCSPA